MKLLLHICCAPCALAPFLELVSKELEISGFFYNPNIHPLEEYEKRLKAVKSFSDKEKLSVIFPEYEPEMFFAKVSGREKLAKERCPLCWGLRLERSASYAKENNFDAFTTTLLISPYQDHEQIKKIGFDLAEKYGLDFYYQDFRPLFGNSQTKAREQQLYRQKYCGCVFGLEEQKNARTR